ncbi:hypothetical protein chiPu_0010277 [Chiloscyllium punctatum]|uniref:Uncharacterized protein n=1 Tax=Chiloscyllium punctatum TaxID=137246 RepID=A0A401SN76_CHIPU|nr:hypothetical protein [Chiloscyllium punctatum]
MNLIMVLWKLVVLRFNITENDSPLELVQCTASDISFESRSPEATSTFLMETVKLLPANLSCMLILDMYISRGRINV